MAEMARVGLRTRARALAVAAAAAAAVTGSSRKRKVENQEIISHTELSSGKNRRRVMITPENSVSVSVSPPVDTGGHRSFIQEDICNSLGSSVRASASCCSSNGSSDDQRNNKLADLEDESFEVETSVCYSCTERRETTSSSQLCAESSDDPDSTARPMPAANPRRRSTAAKLPTESELDEFFTESEKNIRKRFADKYNYDIVKDEPLEGRYQWVRLKP